MTSPQAERVQLGLIGDNIAASSSPRLHELAGALLGLDVRYDRLVPAVEGLSYDQLFARSRDTGFRGLNITYPYKERITAHVKPADAVIAALGAVNTVRFTPQGPIAYNTDYSGFMAAYRAARGQSLPGTTALIGCGGVGRAIAFGLGVLGAAEIALFDADLAKAEALGRALEAQFPALRARAHATALKACAGASGIVNGTPIGMVGKEGCPVPVEALPGADWVFDAVYTPYDTQFLRAAALAGLTIISGWELFFWQGQHAFRIFTGQDIDPALLRAHLDPPPPLQGPQG